ncbi:MAG: response regulator [Nitrospirota bacterium]|nr:response regulator [Nitrospirota bacterium]
MRHQPRTTDPVLIADDDTDDCLIAMEAWEEGGFGNDLRFVQDGLELMDYLYQRGRFADASTAPRPGLILLDLSMPKKNGLEALAEIKSDLTLREIPTLILSTSNTPKEASVAYSLGACGFITKPSTFHGYLNVMRDVREAWLDMNDFSSLATTLCR